MGYRSDITVGLHRNIMARHLITNELPAILKNELHELIDDCFYWKLSGYKWYSAATDIAEVETYFEKLTEEAIEIETDESWNSSELSLFGAIRLGEDNGDIQEWGNPSAFEISIYCAIESPSGTL